MRTLRFRGVKYLVQGHTAKSMPQTHTALGSYKPRPQIEDDRYDFLGNVSAVMQRRCRT